MQIRIENRIISGPKEGQGWGIERLLHLTPKKRLPGSRRCYINLLLKPIKRQVIGLRIEPNSGWMAVFADRRQYYC